MAERVSELPSRYEPLARLGKGGGGEVWAVRDRHTRRQYALKLLDPEASERETAALVREAVALSGLEGLGVPRVVRFGVVPGQHRPYMLRELVEGQSLDELIQSAAPFERLLESLARAAEQLTVLHRAGLLHGDVKPGNIIVEASGRTTFVDLGLAAPWKEGGAPAEGLTPRYAAPELFEGKPLTVRAEVYALGVALGEALASGNQTRSPRVKELLQVAARATAEEPDERFPSVDEFASALRRAAGLATATAQEQNDLVWPIAGGDVMAAQLFEAALALPASGLLRVLGPPSSGRSVLLRRLAWSLGVQGHPLAYIDDATSPSLVAAELEGQTSSGLLVLVDDADALSDDSVSELERVRAAGARLVLVSGARFGEAQEFIVPALDQRAASELVRRAIPSLTDGLLRRVVELSGGRPGELRRLVRLIASDAVASAADIERKLAGVDVNLSLPTDALERAVYFLDRGRFTDAKAALDSMPDLGPERRVELAVARARLELGLGDAATALEGLRAVLPELESVSEDERKQHALYLGRAYVGVSDYQRALDLLAPLAQSEGALGAEALSYRGLALALLSRGQEALVELERAVRMAETGPARVQAVALASLGLAQQRAERSEDARATYQRAIDAAERASDAGTLANVQLNLAGLLKIRGDIAGAIERFEAAVDMGRRSGRRLTARQALLNLANTDLYLGRLARARASIDALEENRVELPPMMRAQLSGLQADLLARQGQVEQAVSAYDACAAGFEAVGRAVDSAEARLEAVLAGSRLRRPDVAELQRRLALARSELTDTNAHRPLLLLASARVAELSGDDAEARRCLEEALTAARETGQREWVWRTLETRAALVEAAGQPFMARRDREEALAVLEEIGARLPRDLREVYWNDPRRRQLRAAVPSALGVAATEFLPFSPSLAPGALSGPVSQRPTLLGSGTSISQLSTTPLEQRLSRILEVNSELVGELDLERLTARVTEYAVELSRAERGFVLLEQPDGSLTVHTSRTREGDEAHAEFSRSIARTVLSSGQAVVALDARGSAEMAGYASVHQLMLESVACVPILSPSHKTIGALYLETRSKRGVQFERELPTLQAFANQVAIALENARLISENKRRADELAAANASLEEAQERLRELLGDRTEQLRRTRQKLRDARETLYGHFGYQGLVGTSAAMRRVYALIDRIKDTDVPVLITGESGTGKEVVARAIHQGSPRAKAKMLGVNCGAIPENLLESELFGHVRGAFTGADRERKGLFRECDGGTILLDEIGEMPMKMQAGLLRVLQERKVRPVGGTHEEPVDVRLVFATHRDLNEMVRGGRFREDLYYRIHVVEVHLPALRERRDDIPQLTDFFLGIFAARYKREKGTITREALRRLSDYDWPGNVRQLENVLLNAWVMSEGPDLLPEDFELPDGFQPKEIEVRALPVPAAPRPRPPNEPAISRAERITKPRKGTVSEHHRDERERILEALRSCNWNRVKAAELSGIPRRTFYRRLREYGIQ